MTASLLQTIKAEYSASLLSVKQIAAKHGICVRTVYNAVSGITNRRGYAKAPRVQIRMTEQEASALLSCIARSGNNDPVLQGVSDRIRDSFEDRMLSPAFPR